MNITWRVRNVERFARNDVIHAIHWECVAEENGKIGMLSGTLFPDSDSVKKQYIDLTESDIVGIIRDSLPSDDIESAVVGQITVSDTVKVGIPWVEKAAIEAAQAIEAAESVAADIPVVGVVVAERANAR